LTAEQVTRWSRHLLLPQVGELGQRRLHAARVCVVGAGGLGAPVLLYLAAAGVGRLGVVDADDVALSNLQRQVIHGTSDVGSPKVASAARRVAALDPGVEVVTHHVRLTQNDVDLLADYDLVVDGTDNFETRYLVNDACVRLGLPEVWGSVLGFDAQVSVFWGRPPAGVPAVELRDLFPEPPSPGEVPSCDQAGVLGALCGQVGSLMATEAVKLLTGVGEPLLGRVAVLDALAARWAEVPVVARPAAAPAHPRPAVASPVPAAAPGALRALSPAELAELVAAGAVTLLDVREPAERSIARIPGAVAVPLGQLLVGTGRDAIPRDLPVVVYCHLGVRSLRAGLALLADGWPDVAHLAGGIDAWSTQIDPSVPRY
jgi:adenylyltransferase/sulfurtransferase